MVREFTLPDVGEGVAEGELVSWLVAEGDVVSEDQPVAEVETDKALVEVPAPVNGMVEDLRYEDGDVIPVGEVFITFTVEGEEETTPEADTNGAKPAEPVDEDEPAGDPGSIEGEASEGEPPADRIFVPPRVRRIAREEGIDLAAIKGRGPGGRITAADVLAAASDSPVETGETDEPGETAVTEPDRTELETAVAEPETDSTAEVGGQQAGPTQIESADRDRTLAAPATRRLAREAGIDIDAIPTDETREGEAFVTPETVTAYAEAQRQAQQANADAIAAGEPVADSGTEAGAESATATGERREPFEGVRKRIADAMVESKSTIPHVTHHDEVDVTELVATRDRLKPRAKEQGIRLTYMPFLMKAVVAALKTYPEMNAVIDDKTDEIVYRDYYNIGVATATDAGLMVPVVENADRKGLLQLASEMNELVEKARDRSISPAELQGSTFTITNVGGIGGEYATPIINYPETGILAIGELKRKPRVVDRDGEESIEPRSVLTLSLSFDHRLIDGAIGARFTNTVMEYLENPTLLLLE